MKHRMFFLMVLAIMTASTTIAQPKYALFLHGFEGTEESWLYSNTPQDWVNEGVINGYVNFVYSSNELQNSTTQAALVQRMTQAMMAQPSNTRWVIVGHSLGGLVARMAYTAIKQNPSTQHLSILSTLTIGTPHQGARAANVAAPNLCGGPTYVPYGYTNVQPVIDEFRFRVEDPLSIIHPVVGVYVGITEPSALGQLGNAPAFLDSAFCKLKVWEQASITFNANTHIGVNGSVIQAINSGAALQPPFRRSVIGAEKAFVPVRAAADAMGLDNGDEMKVLGNFYNIRTFYIANRNAWDASVTAYEIACVLSLDWNCSSAASARRKRDRWSRGRDALNNIDVSWGQIVDSYIPITFQHWEWVNTGIWCSGDIGEPNPWDPVPVDGNCIGGELHEYQLITYTYYVPGKNDVLVGPEYAVWSPGQDPLVANGINYYYNDVPTDGGYNHFELRRYKRAYTLPGVFNAGDYADPMFEARTWLIGIFQ